MWKYLAWTQSILRKMKLFLLETIHGYIKSIRTLLFWETVLGNYDHSSISNVDQSSVPKLGTAQWSEFCWSRCLQCTHGAKLRLVKKITITKSLKTDNLITMIRVIMIVKKIVLPGGSKCICAFVFPLLSHMADWFLAYFGFFGQPLAIPI